MNIKINISSSKDYVDKTVPFLVNSLINSGFDKNDIYVFEGKNEKEEYSFNNFHHYKILHDAMEFNSYLSIIDNKLDFQNWFFLHDTCRVGVNFKKLLYENTDFSQDCIPLKNWPSMNMGFLKYDYLLKHQNKINLFRKEFNLNKTSLEMKNMQKNTEDLLTWKCDTSIKSYGKNSITSQPDKNWYFIEKNKRVQEYYPYLDLYKLKANWGQNIDFVVGI